MPVKKLNVLNVKIQHVSVTRPAVITRSYSKAPEKKKARKSERKETKSPKMLTQMKKKKSTAFFLRLENLPKDAT
jgi:hypothetical protein